MQNTIFSKSNTTSPKGMLFKLSTRKPEPTILESSPVRCNLTATRSPGLISKVPPLWAAGEGVLETYLTDAGQAYVPR